MILDTTHIKRNQEELIKDLVGKPFSFIQAIKMKGIVCKSLMIDDVSPNMNEYINTINGLNYANLELRPFGVIVRINEGLKNYSWVIPYYQLVVYKVNGFSIHAQGRFIHLIKNKTLKKSKPFFDKILDQKIQYEYQHSITAF